MIINWTNFWKIEDNAMVHTDKADDIALFMSIDEKICWAREAELVALMYNPVRKIAFAVERYSIPAMGILEYQVDEYKVEEDCAYSQSPTIRCKREECAIMLATCLLCDDLVVNRK